MKPFIAILAGAILLGNYQPAQAEGCSGHGTTINFYDTPKEAAKVAKKEEKLVFVLHVSGNFEDPRFT
ncbi:MAG: hypothetical protein EXR99_04985 [Gemmataceae bacterium]|nr:hypothetical protein [Gemmataceae bacterium]